MKPIQFLVSRFKIVVKILWGSLDERKVCWCIWLACIEGSALNPNTGSQHLAILSVHCPFLGRSMNRDTGESKLQQRRYHNGPSSQGLTYNKLKGQCEDENQHYAQYCTCLQLYLYFQISSNHLKYKFEAMSLQPLCTFFLGTLHSSFHLCLVV